MFNAAKLTKELLNELENELKQEVMKKQHCNKDCNKNCNKKEKNNECSACNIIIFPTSPYEGTTTPVVMDYSLYGCE